MAQKCTPTPSEHTLVNYDDLKALKAKIPKAWTCCKTCSVVFSKHIVECVDGSWVLHHKG